MKSKYGYIYKFTLVPTGLIYVGKRARSEFDDTYWGSGVQWSKALYEYRYNNKADIIQRDILAWAYDLEELNSLEKLWIDKLDAQNKSIGYNVANGGNGGSSKDYLWYNDGITEFYVHKDGLSNIPSNYIPGRLFYHNVNAGHIWINNGLIQTHCLPEDAIEYINFDNNWEYGMLYRGDNWAINATEHFRTPECSDKRNKGIRKFHSNHPEFRNDGMFKPGQKPHNTGRISITDGVKNKYIKLDDLIPEGWWRGSTQHHNKKEKIC